jgi:hypothetical protein
LQTAQSAPTCYDCFWRLIWYSIFFVACSINRQNSFLPTKTGGNLSPALRAVRGQLSWQTNEPFYGQTAATICRPICNWIASGPSCNPETTRFAVFFYIQCKFVFSHIAKKRMQS